MLITVPLSPRRLPRLANPLAASRFDNFLSIAFSMLLSMKRGHSNNWTKVGHLTTRLAARLVALRQVEIRLNQGEDPIEPGDQGVSADAQRGTKTGPLSRLNKEPQVRGAGGVRGGIGRVCAHPGETVIQVATSVWGTRRDRPEQSHGAPARSVPADFNSSSAASYRVRQSRLLSRRRRAFFSPLKTVV